MASDDRSAVGEPPQLAYRWLGHASLVLSGPPTVAVDPWRWRLGAVADVALVTHGHVDHCSEDDLAEALVADAPIAAPVALARRLEATFPDRIMPFREGDETHVGSARVLALPSEGPRRGGRPSGFLPRGSGLAYLVETPAVRALVLGDSVVLDEHEGHAPDVAFVAVGGLVTATPEEAAEHVGRIGAKVVVPVHWGDLEARYPDAVRFVQLCAERGVRAVIAHAAGEGSNRSEPR